MLLTDEWWEGCDLPCGSLFQWVALQMQGRGFGGGVRWWVVVVALQVVDCRIMGYRLLIVESWGTCCLIGRQIKDKYLDNILFFFFIYHSIQV
jgi:hypothetical protein